MGRGASPADAGEEGGWQDSYTWSGTGIVAWQQPCVTQCRLREGVGEYTWTECATALVLAEIELDGAEESLAPPIRRRLPLAERARIWVETHVEDETLCVDRMAKALNMSRSSLHRNLVRCTGRAPGAFIRQVRLQWANRLLRGGARSVSEVAWSVGFVSLSGFSRAYRQRYGKPPSSVHCPPEL